MKIKLFNRCCRMLIIIIFCLIGVFLSLKSIALAQETKGEFFSEDYVNGNGIIDSARKQAEEDRLLKAREEAARKQAEEQANSNKELKERNPFDHVINVMDQIRNVPNDKLKSKQGTASNIQERIDYLRENLQNSSHPQTISKTTKTTMAPTPNVVSSLKASEDEARQTVVSLVVSGEPKRHLIQKITEMMDAQKKLGIQLGSIYVVTGDRSAQKGWKLINDPEISALMAQAPRAQIAVEMPAKVQRHGVRTFTSFAFQLKFVDNPPEEYNLKNSPAWIVRYKDRDHVFEGEYRLVSLFNYEGKFLPEKFSQAASFGSASF